MDKTVWTAAVSVTFLIATFVGFPDRFERFKPVLQIAAWTILALAVVGWLWAHASTVQEWRTRTSNSPLTLTIVGAIGAALAIGLFLSWAPTSPKRATVVQSSEQVKELLTPVAPPYREVVAEIVHAFEPHAKVLVGGATIGPDGARTVDIQVWSLDRNEPRTTGIDVIDRPNGEKVGIEAVDVAEAKLRDLKMDAMLISSNTGFSDEAIRKAKRVGVGLIAALNRGDGRIKAVIEEEIFLRKVKLGAFSITYDGVDEQDGATLRALKDITAVSYTGAPISKWLAMQASKLVETNIMSRHFVATPAGTQGLRHTFTFKQPIVVDAEGREVRLKGVSYFFQPQVQWLSQTVRLDATAAIYDYRRGRIRMGPGAQQYVISGVNFDAGKPIEGPPPELKGVMGLQPGEVVMMLFVLEDVALPTPPRELVTAFAALEEQILPEDLLLKIEGE